MAYTSWSVVFGEQPSAAKWNILGTNDASFNDGTGIANAKITSEHLKATIAFHAYRNASQSVGSSLETILFDTERYDLGADFNTTTGQFTAPVAGIYHFDTGINNGTAAQTRCVIQFVFSSAGNFIPYDNTGTDINKSGASITIDLNASETAEVKVLQLSDQNVASTETFFAGYYVGSDA